MFDVCFECARALPAYLAAAGTGVGMQQLVDGIASPDVKFVFEQVALVTVVLERGRQRSQEPFTVTVVQAVGCEQLCSSGRWGAGATGAVSAGAKAVPRVPRTAVEAGTGTARLGHLEAARLGGSVGRLGGSVGRLGGSVGRLGGSVGRTGGAAER
jgi:hypothetical protein